MNDEYWEKIDRFCYTKHITTVVEYVCRLGERDNRVCVAAMRTLMTENQSMPTSGMDMVIIPTGSTVGEFAIGSRERRDRTQRYANDSSSRGRTNNG